MLVTTKKLCSNLRYSNEGTYNISDDIKSSCSMAEKLSITWYISSFNQVCNFDYFEERS